MSDPGLPLHVLDVRQAVWDSPAQSALPPASAVQRGEPGDPGSTDLLVYFAAEESEQTLHATEERVGGQKQRQAEDILSPPDYKTAGFPLRIKIRQTIKNILGFKNK